MTPSMSFARTAFAQSSTRWRTRASVTASFFSPFAAFDESAAEAEPSAIPAAESNATISFFIRSCLRATSHSFCDTTLRFSIPRTVLIFGIMFSFVLFWILFKLWQRGIHLVPRVRVGCPHIHLRAEPARIIQARSSHRDKLRDRVRLDHDRRAAVRAKRTSAGQSQRSAQ